MTSLNLDRAVGALVGLAAGDALGAGYEFTTPSPEAPIQMIGGGIGAFEPGEWTDDTAQAVAIARVTAEGRLDLDQVGQGFLDWFAGGPKDVGISTGAVLAEAARAVVNGTGVADALTAAGASYFAEHPRGAAGNGSLMRTSPVALAHLADDRAIADAARAVSGLTHADPLAAEACVLWCVAIDRAVREGTLDGVWEGLELLGPGRAGVWHRHLTTAEEHDPATFTPNGFVVTALQAAHAAIAQTPVPHDQPCRHLQHALEAAVRIGHDTDTVAAIAGQVLGARWGVSAIPWRWRRMLHGWPSMRFSDLVRLAVLTANGGLATGGGWPATASMLPWARTQKPDAVCEAGPVDGLWLGNLPGLAVAVEQGVDAVVSLCRVGTDDVPDDVEHVQGWLSDQAAPANPNLAFVIEDPVDAITTLHGQGKQVYVHCVGARSRTPTVVAAWLADHLGITRAEALDRIAAVLPEVRPNPTFQQYLDGPEMPG